MAITGSDLVPLWKRKINAAYSQQYSTAQQSALFNESLIKVLEDIYRNGSSNYVTDQVRAMVSTENLETTASNTVDITSITDFNHIMAVKCIIEVVPFKPTLTNIILIDGTYTRIVLSRASALRSTEQVKIASTPITGTYYVKQLTDVVYELYTDETLLVPFYNGLPYANDGTIKRVIQTYAIPYVSEEKIGYLSNPTVYYPKFQLANNLIKVYAGGSPITGIEIDYLTTLPLVIDVTDSTNDLLEFYPQEMLYMMLDKAAILFASETRDNVLSQTEGMEIMQNKQQLNQQ